MDSYGPVDVRLRHDRTTRTTRFGKATLMFTNDGEVKIYSKGSINLTFRVDELELPSVPKSASAALINIPFANQTHHSELGVIVQAGEMPKFYKFLEQHLRASIKQAKGGMLKSGNGLSQRRIPCTPGHYSQALQGASVETSSPRTVKDSGSSYASVVEKKRQLDSLLHSSVKPGYSGAHNDQNVGHFSFEATESLPAQQSHTSLDAEHKLHRIAKPTRGAIGYENDVFDRTFNKSASGLSSKQAASNYREHDTVTAVEVDDIAGDMYQPPSPLVLPISSPILPKTEESDTFANGPEFPTGSNLHSPITSKFAFRGLPNVRNSCFMNSSIQALYALPLLVKSVLCRSDEFEEHTVIYQLGNVIREMLINDHPGTKHSLDSKFLRAFRTATGKLNEDYDGFTQQDAHQFIIHVLDDLHETSVSGPEIQVLEGDEGKENNAIPSQSSIFDNKSGSSKTATENVKSAVESVRFELKRSIWCTCGSKRTRTEQFLDIQVALQTEADDMPSIQKMIEHYLARSVVEVNCDDCKSKKNFQCTGFEKLPEYLIVCVKRYVYDGGRSRKVQKRIIPNREIRVQHLMTNSAQKEEERQHYEADDLKDDFAEADTTVTHATVPEPPRTPLKRANRALSYNAAVQQSTNSSDFCGSTTSHTRRYSNASTAATDGEIENDRLEDFGDEEETQTIRHGGGSDTMLCDDNLILTKLEKSAEAYDVCMAGGFTSRDEVNSADIKSEELLYERKNSDDVMEVEFMETVEKQDPSKVEHPDTSKRIFDPNGNATNGDDATSQLQNEPDISIIHFKKCLTPWNPITKEEADPFLEKLGCITAEECMATAITNTPTWMDNSEPTNCPTIDPDGNCYFRSLSMIFYGADWHHDIIRKSLVDFIQKHSEYFASLCSCPGHRNFNNHCETMGENGEWATQVELFATATAFCCTVYTHLDKQWHCYRPLFCLDDAGAAHPLPAGYRSYRGSIYLVNLAGCHFAPVLEPPSSHSNVGENQTDGAIEYNPSHCARSLPANNCGGSEDVLPNEYDVVTACEPDSSLEQDPYKFQESDDPIYTLASVVCHHGTSLQYGHYTALVFDPTYRSWLRCDDTTIEEISEKDVLHRASQTGYVFLYRRRHAGDDDDFKQ